MTRRPPAAGRLDWRWAAKCRLLGGHPTRELFDEAVAAGEAAVPLMVDILSRRDFREGEPPDCAQLPVHAMRVLGALRAESAIPALVNVLADPVDPGLHGEEAALALARIGEPSLAVLEGVLRDVSRDTWVRVSAARGLAFAALADRRHRPRARAAFERLFLDPKEPDRLLVGHVVTDACALACAALLPAVEAAYAAGRVDEDVIDLDSARRDLILRRHRADPDAKNAVRRDVREDYVPWEELAAELRPYERRRLEQRFARIDVRGARPPRRGAAADDEE